MRAKPLEWQKKSKPVISSQQLNMMSEFKMNRPGSFGQRLSLGQSTGELCLEFMIGFNSSNYLSFDSKSCCCTPVGVVVMIGSVLIIGLLIGLLLALLLPSK